MVPGSLQTQKFADAEVPYTLAYNLCNLHINVKAFLGYLQYLTQGKCYLNSYQSMGNLFCFVELSGNFSQIPLVEHLDVEPIDAEPVHMKG